MRALLTAVCVITSAAAAFGFLVPPPDEPDRSPIDLALLPGGHILTANHTSDSVSLADLNAGKVLAERPCGHRPAAVACPRDGRRAAVAASWGGTVSLFEIADDSLEP